MAFLCWARLALWVQDFGRHLIRHLKVTPVSLRLGHRTALALLMQFTTVLPLRYPLEKA